MPAAYDEPSFLGEVWGLFAIGTYGVALLALRFVVRVRTVGTRNFCGDDYFSILVLLCYIGDAITVDMTYHLGTNVDFSVGQLNQMGTDDLKDITLGSKLQLLAWYTYTGLIWALKACMLFFFGRLTSGLHVQRYVRILSCATALSYLSVFLTISLGCFPIERNWQVVPSPGVQCTFKPQNLYVTSIANIATDAFMLAIPIPILWGLKVGRRRKLGLSLLLFPGAFVIAAAIVRVIMSLEGTPSALNVNRWGVRETLAGILAVNIPILRPLLTRTFYIRESASKHPNTSTSLSSKREDRDPVPAYPIRLRNDVGASASSVSGGRAKTQLTSVQGIEMMAYDSEACGGAYSLNNDSQELIVQGSGNFSGVFDVRGNGILVETTFGSSMGTRRTATSGVPWETQGKSPFRGHDTIEKCPW